MARNGSDLGDGSVLHEVIESSLADRCHAAWVLLGSAAGRIVVLPPTQLRRDVQDVLRMLDVAAPDVLRHRPGKRRGRRRVHVRNG